MPAIKDGIAAAGRPDALAALDDAAVQMVFYAHEFREAGAMGLGASADEFDDDQLRLAEALAEEWVRRAAGRARDPGLKRDGEIALTELSESRSAGESMGLRSLRRRALAAAARIRFFAEPTFAVAQTVVNRSLREVTHYLSDTGGLRRSIRGAVLDAVRPDTQIVIGHSLGSVIAYEAMHQAQSSVDLLVTLGSPLGVDSVVFPKLEPPARFPEKVRWWVNAADPNDIVAADPTLADRFGHEWQGRIRDLEVDNGKDWHAIGAYLRQTSVANAIADVLLGAV